MKNSYEIRGDITVIFLKRRDGSLLETLIDTVDLPKVIKFSNTWFATWSNDTQGFYVKGNLNYKTILLHRCLFDEVDRGMVIDHIDGNTLDNRRSVNLRVADESLNQHNRLAQKNNNSSGISGVKWNRKLNKWEARFSYKGKGYYVGVFVDKHEAGMAVIKRKALVIGGDFNGRQGLEGF